MRAIILSILLSLTVVSASADSSDSLGYRTFNDRWVPWPWSMAQPFPWESISGMWKIQSEGNETYFVFRVINKTGQFKQLQIKQLDAENCKVLATGVGLEKSSRVLAQMTTKGGSSFRLSITSFDKEDSPEPPGGLERNSVMVVSVQPLNAKSTVSEVHYQMMKVSRNYTVKSCSEYLKN